VRLIKTERYTEKTQKLLIADQLNLSSFVLELQKDQHGRSVYINVEEGNCNLLPVSDLKQLPINIRKNKKIDYFLLV